MKKFLDDDIFRVDDNEIIDAYDSISGYKTRLSKIYSIFFGIAFVGSLIATIIFSGNVKSSQFIVSALSCAMVSVMFITMLCIYKHNKNFDQRKRQRKNEFLNRNAVDYYYRANNLLGGQIETKSHFGFNEIHITDNEILDYYDWRMEYNTNLSKVITIVCGMAFIGSLIATIIFSGDAKSHQFITSGLTCLMTFIIFIVMFFIYKHNKKYNRRNNRKNLHTQKTGDKKKK